MQAFAFAIWGQKRGKLDKDNCQNCETCDTKSFYPDFCRAGLENNLFGRYLMQFLLTSFDNRDIFKFSIWTTLAGHDLGYEEYMRKNFLVTITFPLLVNVANVYFFFKVIMPARCCQRAPITFILRGWGIFEKLGDGKGSCNKRWPHFFTFWPHFFAWTEFDQLYQTGAEILGRLWQKEKNDLDWKVQKELDHI